MGFRRDKRDKRYERYKRDERDDVGATPPPHPCESVGRFTPCSSCRLAFTKTAKKRISTLPSFSSPLTSIPFLLQALVKASVRMRRVQDSVLPWGRGGEASPHLSNPHPHSSLLSPVNTSKSIRQEAGFSCTLFSLSP